MKRILIIAGPNGAGKTTFARQYLPNEGRFRRFINADLIAADVAIARVIERVAQGGHDIPAVVIRRRFERGWANFIARYRQLVDFWLVLDNSGANTSSNGGGIDSLRAQEPTPTERTEAILKAMARAAEDARQVAERTNTKLVLVTNNTIRRISPASIDYEQVSQGLMERGIYPGSREYAEGILKAISVGDPAQQ